MPRVRQDLDDLSASSDDDAPEEIGMSAGKKQSLSQAHRFREQERVSKEAEKEKRRKRNEMFKLQKEKKLENINKRAIALPSDVLEAVSTKYAKVSNEGDEVPEGGHNLAEDVDSNDEGLDDRLSDSGVEDDSNVNEEDYIPLNSSRHGGLNVVTLQNFTSQKMSSAEAALSFRNSRLFGAQSAPRDTAKQRQAKRHKKQVKRR